MLVTVQGGQVVLDVDDDTAEVVTFSATDSFALGLTVLDTLYTQTAANETIDCLADNTFDFDVTTFGAPLADATVTVFSNSDTNRDFFSVVIEGDSHGNVFSGAGARCQVASEDVVVPMVSMLTYVSDQTVSITTIASDGNLCGFW